MIQFMLHKLISINWNALIFSRERSDRPTSGFQRPERIEGGFAPRDDGPREGFARGRGGGRGRGSRGSRGGRGVFPGKREFERHSGSDKTWDTILMT